MPSFVFANNVSSTIASSITSTATTITLSSAARFPTIPAGYVWAVTLNDAATGQIFEIVYVTSTSGANLQGCLRGQEGTPAQAWLANDKAFAADTAGILSSFETTAQAAGLVQLNPATQQSGFINVSGAITAGGQGNFAGASVGGAVTNATTGTFSGAVTALDFTASLPYASGVALLWKSNPAYGNGTVGFGSNSATSAAGIPGDAVVLSVGAIGYALCVDHNLNLGVAGEVVANNNLVSLSGSVIAPTIVQNGTQVVSTITSGTLAVTRSGSSYDIEIAELVVGAMINGNGNGGPATIVLPSYGTWFIEVMYGISQTTNSNLTVRLAQTGGTMTSGFISNANGTTAYNAIAWLLLYGKGYTTVNNQTLTFTLTVSGGPIDPSNQPWTVRGTRAT